MKKIKLVRFSGLIFCLGVHSQSTIATGFLPQDSRSMAMGGAGVAVGNSRQAHYYNPSLLTNSRADEDFNIEVDATIRLADTDKLLPGIRAIIKNKPFNDLDIIIKNLSKNQSQKNATAAIESLKKSLSSIQDVSNKSITLDSNGGVFLSAPNLNIVSWAAYINSWANISWSGNLSDNDNNSLNSFVRVAEALNNNQTPNARDTKRFFEFDTGQDLQSSITRQGAIVTELGIALAMHQTIDNYAFDIGLTPKLQYVTTFGEEIKLIHLTENNTNPYNTDMAIATTKINFDIGVSKILTENWKTGLVIKNFIPYSYDVPNVDREIKIAPSARIGAAYISNWFSAGFDYDLTINNDIASYTKTRFLAVGAEIDIWVLQLRGGYRHNFTSSGGSGPSVGIGLYLAGLNIDAAIASNNFEPTDITDVDNINASVQLGVNW